MGYYNDPPSRSKKPSRTGTFLTALAGVLVGALVVWLLFSTVPGLAPGNNTATETATGQTEGSTSSNAVEITTDVTEAVEIADDAVVGITNLQEANNFWNGSQGMEESQEQAVGSGSGVIYKNEDGRAFVVTNHHVVEGASGLEVTMSDGSKIEAELVGSDIWTDLAVLEMDGATVKDTIEFGDSDALKQGETVIAIGSPLGLEFSGSVTTGVVSGTDRAVPVDLDGDGQVDWQAEVLQTDAAINPGNSGGALVNLAGQLIGINSMKIATAAVEGIGFAIPINSAIPVIESLEKTGEMVRPAMGITLIDLAQVPQRYRQETLNLPADVKEGVVVDRVVENSAAAKAGMEQYDVIVEMDGEPVGNILELRQHLYTEKKVGDTMTVKAYRNGEEMTFELELVDDSAI
ncbi:trypsin-like peptidase domain-containing protein [Planococcus sp. N028]|uniref:Trypsin-like peptidase domain-containing protein n=1 Tax=Planococcus shixiaomingii TaxID=3058393 RepID=A0ABT8N3V2_9BACL|nr:MULTISPECIES: trypsin-like peptidase domain-containing protein [unclassified Planococcus (in: firmicutes)]MDN7242561.1 trypsin-like peptidase domain-containing protein [Planococcus sp. N028]WKA54796.1 trypsin-like peptidase domain-containing protein [Planococcus sp. N022]